MLLKHFNKDGVIKWKKKDLIIFTKKKIKKKIGVIGVRHETNIGNNLIKYAMSIKLSELGYIPYIIGTVWKQYNNIEFINQTTKLVIIKNNYHFSNTPYAKYMKSLI